MLVGQRVGPFAIEKTLGSGAMGTVYLGRYEKTGQHVAIKLMSPGLSGNETIQARFEQEAAILKKLHHPNIVRFFGTGHYQGSPYYAMEYVQGESLDHVIERAVLMSTGSVVTAFDLALEATPDARLSARLEEMSLEDAERLLIKKALARFEGNANRAAEALGLSRSALYRRLQKYGLS